MKKPLILLVLLFTGLLLQAQKSANTDSAQIRTTILSFYNWYLKNHAKLNAFQLYTGMQKKDAPPYRINWKEADRYYAFIRNGVPQLGEAFIANQKRFLKECDSAFKADTEGEIPYGFDYDWYTNSQEDPEWLVDELRKSKQWVTTVNGNDATVDVLGYYTDNGKQVETVVMCFKMKKEKLKWKIAKIGCEFSADFNKEN